MVHATQTDARAGLPPRVGFVVSKAVGGAVVATAAFSFLGSYAILKLIDGAMGLRFSQEEEATGLDLTQHNERAYS